MSAAPIEGASPIPIWRILTPGMILYIRPATEWTGLVFVAFRSILLPSRSGQVALLKAWCRVRGSNSRNFRRARSSDLTPK